MSFLFGRSKTPQEMMKEHQRLLRRSMREMDRERASLQQQEKKIIIEIKKMAKSGQMVRGARVERATRVREKGTRVVAWMQGGDRDGTCINRAGRERQRSWRVIWCARKRRSKRCIR